VREAEYQDLRARVHSRALQGLFFVHMKQGLDVASLDWIGCDDPTVVPRQSLATTDYGIDKTLQRQLAAMRTDLDSFSELESALLMLSGYRMTEQQFRELQRQHLASGEDGSWGGFDIAAPRADWPFLVLEDLARLPPDAADARRQEIHRQMAASSMLFFRVWYLSPLLRVLAGVAGVGAAVGAIAWIALNWNTAFELTSGPFTVGAVALALLLFGAGVVAPVLRWLTPQQAVRGVLFKLGVAVVGWVAGRVHLAIFDPLFLRIGSLRRLLRLP
jgi:hypothetical protein